MLIKPLILGVSITLGLLAIAVTLRFIVYPLGRFGVKEMKK